MHRAWRQRFAYYTHSFLLAAFAGDRLAIIGRLYDRQIAREQLLMQTVGLVGETGSKTIAQILRTHPIPERAAPPPSSAW